MSEIYVFGREQFTIGFVLAGVRKTVIAKEDPYYQIQDLLKEPNCGILIIDEAIMEKLDDREQTELEDTVKPVVFVLSEKETQESFRRLVKKSIGIDLLKNE